MLAVDRIRQFHHFATTQELANEGDAVRIDIQFLGVAQRILVDDVPDQPHLLAKKSPRALHLLMLRLPGAGKGRSVLSRSYKIRTILGSLVETRSGVARCTGSVRLVRLQ